MRTHTHQALEAGGKHGLGLADGQAPLLVCDPQRAQIRLKRYFPLYYGQGGLKLFIAADHLFSKLWVMVGQCWEEDSLV
jgi:hypothetical protein